MKIMLTGTQIREMRDALGETMTQFAERLGVSEATICYWEQNKRHPNYPAMVKLNELWQRLAGVGGNIIKDKPAKKAMVRS